MQVKIFFCYAREDEALLNKLKAQLKPLQRQGFIDIWHDRDISAGTEWEREISQQLNEAHIILLLISPDFMNSDYCYGIEMKRALERHDNGDAHVIPIILRHVYWRGEPLGKLQALPTDAIPIVSPKWHSLDEAFYDVTEGIRKAVNTYLVQDAMTAGEAHFSTHNYREALACYEDAIRFEPDDASAYNSKGVALVELERYQEALTAFEQAIRLNPNNAHIHNNLGSALGYLKRYNEALEAFEQAIRHNPNNAEIYINKGHVFHDLKCYRKALEALEQAAALDANVDIPKIQYIYWAKEILSLPDLAFLEIDTTGLQKDDEIFRILLVNRHGESLFDTFLCSDVVLSSKVSRINGITNEELAFAPTITEAWNEIAAALKGKYLLSFNLEFDQRMLAAAANRYQLEMLSIDGDCLMLRAMMYSGSFSYSKLSTLCAYIDYPLPNYPHQIALHRARGQIALLEAISRGITLEEPQVTITDTPITLETENNVQETATLTVEMVISAWENIRKRTRQKSKSGMLSAYLGYYKIVEIEGSAEYPIVVIEAQKAAHLKYVRDENRYKDLEWALEMEFGLPCQVRLVSPPIFVPQSQAIKNMDEEDVSEVVNKTTLTVQELIASWENIRKRTRQKSKSGMLSAYLGYFKVIDIEGLSWEPVIVIQPEKLAHYKYVRDEGRYKDLEWALEMEFELPCKVRLVQPEIASTID